MNSKDSKNSSNFIKNNNISYGNCTVSILKTRKDKKIRTKKKYVDSKIIKKLLNNSSINNKNQNTILEKKGQGS